MKLKDIKIRHRKIICMDSKQKLCKKLKKVKKYIYIQGFIQKH